MRGGRKSIFKVPLSTGVVGQVRSKTGQRHRLHAQFGAVALSEGLSEDAVQTYQRRKGELQEQIQHLDVEISELKERRKKTEHHIPVKSLPEEERFTRLRTESALRANQRSLDRLASMGPRALARGNIPGEPEAYN